MKLKIEIAMDNAAFETDEAACYELECIFKNLAAHVYMIYPPYLVKMPGEWRKIFDTNGNAVGTVKVTK